jgi:hypothetical protein
MKIQAIEITLADGRKIAAIAAAFHAPGTVPVLSVRALECVEDSGFTAGRVVELYGVRRDD